MSERDERLDDDERVLLESWLDGELGPAQRERFEERLASSREFARSAARMARLHDALDRRLRPAARTIQGPAPSRWRWLAAAAVLLGLIALWNVASAPRASAAHAELERLASAGNDGDRTFELHTLTPGAARRERRVRTEAPIDGALLHLRGSELYVLVRRDARGEQTLSGFDGQWAWSAAPDGPVRLSSDPQRFRGALPGHQHDLPFVDPRDGLAELARNYELQLERSALLDGRTLARIDATRKSNVERGPRRVEVWFEADSARLVRLVLDGLPRAKGGPRAVALELVDEQPLPQDFFQHSHHAPGRAVEREESRR